MDSHYRDLTKIEILNIYHAQSTMPGTGNISVHSFTDLKAFIKYEKKNMTVKTFIV